VKDINVAVPDFIKGMAETVAKTSPETLQAYLRWKLVDAAAMQLTKAFVDEDFVIQSKFTGQEEIQPRWKRCINATDEAYGELLGRYFVEHQFAGDSKTKALDIIHGIEGAFQANLPSLAWMDDTTRGRAVGKMSAIINKIGYPDKWRDYSKLESKKGDYYGNTMAARAFDFDREMAKIGKSVDRTEWGMSPPTVNAYYNPLVNEIVFPAGILQRPFFNRDFTPPMNYGAMGMVVGHELTHGFDDQGRKFDAHGQLKEWWEPAVSAKFDERASCVADLYSSYEPQPGIHLNGKLTLGENIADMGGLKEAFRAYQAWVKKNGEPPVLIEGMTNDQLFFIAFAQSWCTLAQPEFERLMVTTNPHSLPKYRVIGPVSNFPDFARTFNCAEGTPMRPAKTCEVW
jgi:predicted metalloendopeptidase